MTTQQQQVPAGDALSDYQLECAVAAEAVFSFERYLAFGTSPEDFSYPSLRAVAEAAHESWEADGAVSIGTVAKLLQRAGKLDGIGGQAGLSELLTTYTVPDPDRLRELRRLRTIREAALSVAKQASQGDLHGALGALGDAQACAIDAGSGSEPIDAFDLGCEVIEALAQGKQAEQLIHPGLGIMAEAMGELTVGSMMVLGASTNTGKSSVSLEMLLGAAGRNVTCGYVSCEDPKSVVGPRVVSAMSGISSKKIAQGNITRDEWPQLVNATETLKDLQKKLWFQYSIGGNEIDVCAAMSKLAMRGCRLIVVDYIQAIESSKRQQDRRNEVRWLCARLKAHAQRLNIALVLVSQFSRPGKGDEFKEPNKHDLKEAGDLENAADFIVLLWRESLDDFAPINCKLEKSKFGNIGARWQMARGAGARLAELEGSYESAQARRDNVVSIFSGGSR